MAAEAAAPPIAPGEVDAAALDCRFFEKEFPDTTLVTRDDGEVNVKQRDLEIALAADADVTTDLPRSLDIIHSCIYFERRARI